VNKPKNQQIQFPKDGNPQNLNEFGQLEKLRDDHKSRDGKGLSAFFTYQKYWGSGEHHAPGYGYPSNNLNNWNANLNQNYNVNYNTFNDELQNSTGGSEKPPGSQSDPGYVGGGAYHQFPPHNGGTFITGHLLLGHPLRRIFKLRHFGIDLLGLNHLYGTGQFLRARDYPVENRK
jgi:hypothetical protein